MNCRNILFKNEIKINDFISVKIPTLEDVIVDEDAYYGALSMLTSMPVDMMVQLDDLGIDFTTINEYELFLLLFPSLQSMDTSLFFGELNLSNFQIGMNPQNNTVILTDNDSGIVIDRAIHGLIAEALRNINNLKQNNKKPANKEAFDFMLRRARAKLKRQKRTAKDSQLESLIVALVNTEQFNYDFDSVKRLTIYQFNECLQQIVKKIDYDNKMRGIYAGTVSSKNLSQDDLNWLTHK